MGSKHAALVVVVATLYCLTAPCKAYSKYGRSCQDIGCSSNEVCVMEEDPCSIYARNECGRYPTCKRVSNNARTCESYVCPPSQSCKIDKGEPKCFEDPGATGSRQNHVPVQNYNPGEPLGGNSNAPSAPVIPNQPQYPYNPNYPQYPQGQTTPRSPHLYPNIPPGLNGQTTPRPNVYQPGQNLGGGYQGGAVGSGYPGYPQQNSGNYPRYPQGSYPQQPNSGNNRYPQSGYPGYSVYPPQQGGGYPRHQGGYPGYPNQYGNYPPQNGYDRYPPNNKKTNNQGSGFLDKVTDTLKNLGTNLLKDAIKRL